MGESSMAAQTSATELVTMICPNLACRKTVSAPVAARGKTVRCAYCNAPFRVPAAETAAFKPEPKPPLES